MNYVGTKYCDDDVITNENSLVQSDVVGVKSYRVANRRDQAIYHETEVTGGGSGGRVTSNNLVTKTG